MRNMDTKFLELIQDFSENNEDWKKFNELFSSSLKLAIHKDFKNKE